MRILGLCAGWLAIQGGCYGQEPTIINSVAPEYPPLFRMFLITGSVRARISFDEEGKAAAVIQKSNLFCASQDCRSMFDFLYKSVQNAAGQMRVKPDGAPRQIDVTYDFVIVKTKNGQNCGPLEHEPRKFELIAPRHYLMEYPDICVDSTNVAKNEKLRSDYRSRRRPSVSPDWFKPLFKS